MIRLTRHALAAAAYRFEAIRGDRLGPDEMAEIERYSLQDVSADTLVETLKDLLKRGPTEDFPTPGEIYWALGTCRQPRLIDYFRAQLRIELSRDPCAVYQILIALDGLGEKPFSPERSGYGVDETELNQRDAKRYLAIPPAG